MSELVVVSTFLQRHEAQMAKGLLDNKGIKSMISADDCGGMRPGMSFGNAITLSVQKADLEKAKKILQELK
jgi:hypothetical protein